MTWGRGSTRAWRTLRAETLERDPHCRLGYDGCTGISTQADHILNVEAGGSDEPLNLQGVCSPCHAVKTAREAAHGRQASKPKPPAHPGLISPDA